MAWAETARGRQKKQRVPCHVIQIAGNMGPGPRMFTASSWTLVALIYDFFSSFFFAVVKALDARMGGVGVNAQEGGKQQGIERRFCGDYCIQWTFLPSPSASMRIWHWWIWLSVWSAILATEQPMLLTSISTDGTSKLGLTWIGWWRQYKPHPAGLHI